MIGSCTASLLAFADDMIIMVDKETTAPILLVKRVSERKRNAN